MNEAVVAEIDADMGKRRFQCIEEHQVAGLELVRGYRMAQAAQGARAVRQREIGRLLEDVAHEAAAVEAGFGRTAAVFVLDAGQAQGADQHFLSRAGPLVGQRIGLGRLFDAHVLGLRGQGEQQQAGGNDEL